MQGKIQEARHHGLDLGMKEMQVREAEAPKAHLSADPALRGWWIDLPVQAAGHPSSLATAAGGPKGE